jgi:hypothetical protein
MEGLPSIYKALYKWKGYPPFIKGLGHSPYSHTTLPLALEGYPKALYKWKGYPPFIKGLGPMPFISPPKAPQGRVGPFRALLIRGGG